MVQWIHGQMLQKQAHTLTLSPLHLSPSSIVLVHLLIPLAIQTCILALQVSIICLAKL